MRLRALDQQPQHVHAEAIDALLQPEPHPAIHRRAHFRIAPVQIRLLFQKRVQIRRDAWVLDSNTDDIAAIDATFDADYSAAAVGSGRPPAATPAPNLIWSPAGRATFLQQIDAATRSIDATSEELKDRAIVVALGKAAQRGVSCRIVLTANPAWTEAVEELTTAGCSIHLIPDDNKHLYMHEKMLLTDDTTLIIGSQNLSTASLLENRELSLKLDAGTAKPVLDAVESTFDDDYRQAPSGP